MGTTKIVGNTATDYAAVFPKWVPSLEEDGRVLFECRRCIEEGIKTVRYRVRLPVAMTARSIMAMHERSHDQLPEIERVP